MTKDTEILSLANNYFIADKDIAPNFHYVQLHFEPRLLTDTLRRIAAKIDIYENYNPIMIEKVRRLVIPTLLKDKLIIETESGYEVVPEKGLLFNDNNIKEKIKRLAGDIIGSLDTMTPDILHNSKMFYLNYKKIPKEKYNEIVEDAKKILIKIIELENVKHTGDIDCDFTFLAFSNDRNDKELI